MLRGPPLAFMSNVDFAQRLANLRKQQHLTQQALADLANLHVTLIRRYEAGKTQPSIDALRRIALALNVSSDMLLFDEHERGPSDDFKLQFEGLDRLDDDEKATVTRVLEGLLLRNAAKRWAA